MRSMKTLALGTIVLLLFPGSSYAQKRDVSFKAADGVELKGSFYAPERGGPALLLLGNCTAERQAYDTVATMLRSAGYVVFTVDLPRVDKASADVDSAIAFMKTQPTVNARALAVVGAGQCGASQAVGASERHPEIRTVVLLSGGADANGEAFIKKSANLPVLGVASADDQKAVASVKKTISASANPYSRADMPEGAGHGVVMFDKYPDLAADVVLWFRANLPVGGYGLPPALK
jgi:dienelactone hydrolase